MKPIDIRDPEFYADWSEEDLKAHIKRLNEILGKKQGYRPMPTKDLLSKILDPETKDFLGTGLSFQEFLLSGHVRDFQTNIVNQDRDERRRRMDLVIEMSVELAKIKEQTRFATRLAEGVIEDVIKGDWAGVRIMGESFKFEDEHESLRTHEGPIYARFVELCRKAFDGRPEAAEVAEAPKN